MPNGRVADREKEALAQLHRPAFRLPGSRPVAYILFEELAAECAALCRYGEDRRIIQKIARGV